MEINPIQGKALRQFQIFYPIAKFLGLKDLLNFSLTNKEIYQSVQRTFWKMLREQGHITQENYDDKLNIDYHQIYKYFHNKELLYCSISQSIDRESLQQDMKVYRNKKKGLLAGKAIKDYQIGSKLSVFLTYQGELIILNTQELFSHQTTSFITRQNIKEFGISGKE